MIEDGFGWGKTVSGVVLQVELLVMKALSVGLVKGNIDEVDQKVQMTWVQPRVLDLQQVGVTTVSVSKCFKPPVWTQSNVPVASAPRSKV